MIKNIIFDWGGVLILDPAKKLSAYCADYLHIPRQHFRRLYQSYAQDYQTNRISEQQLWKKICTEYKVPTPNIPSLWNQAGKTIFKENKSVTHLVSRLKKNNYQLGLLSNTEIAIAKNYPSQPYSIFDITVFSCDVGIAKPDKAIYDLTLSKLQAKAEETLFIDNSPINIQGGQQAGIQSILFTSARQLRQALKKHGVKI